MKNSTCYIFFTGGVSSSLGKGVTASVLAALLISRGYKVRLRKFDPYINVDAGTISPLQHGEVFVTEDGSETDLDLGHYERFTGQITNGDDNFTTGRLYKDLIHKERVGDFLGQTVQVVPHLTDAIQNIIVNPKDGSDIDFCIIEIGGTVGDIEGLPYIEAIRQMRYRLGVKRTLFMHMTWVPYLQAASEYKTKPTQHAVKELLKLGVKPDILICRSKDMLRQSEIDKISMLCSIDPQSVIVAYDATSIYYIPRILSEQHLDTQVLRYFGLPEFKTNPQLHDDKQGNDSSTSVINQPENIKFVQQCEEFARKFQNSDKKIRVAIVGKYVTLPDSYLSVMEALQHAAVANNVGVSIFWVDAGSLENMSAQEIENVFSQVDAMLVPGGYGKRASVGKMIALRYARNHNIPTLAICFGMQLMVIDLCRDVLKISDATSTEFDEDTKHPVVITLDKWRILHDKKHKISEEYFHKNFIGATMRLGSYVCHLRENTLAAKIYGSLLIHERHRHRYEVNDRYLQMLEKAGELVVSGVNENTGVAEVVEIPKCSYFIGCQYHPEFKSSFNKPHPLFFNLIKTAVDKQQWIN